MCWSIHQLARETPARRSDSPLPPKCPCAPAGPHAPLLDWPTFRPARCLKYVSLGHGSLANVVQGAVVGLPKLSELSGRYLEKRPEG